MLIHPMADRMRGLGLAAMADAFLEMQRTAVADEISREDWLGLMLDREATGRETNVSAIGCDRHDCGTAR